MKPRRRAKQTARAAALPQKQEARQELRMGRRANRAAYGALDRTLSDIGQDYRKDYRQLGTGLRQGLSGLGSMLNVAGGMGGAVGAGAFGGIGASAVRGLGQQRSRGVEATRSTRTQGAIEQKTNALNLLSAFQQRMEDIANQQSANTQALIPEYQQQRFDNRMQRRTMSMAERELEMQEQAASREQELADWYMRNLQNQRQRQQGRQQVTNRDMSAFGPNAPVGGAGRAAMQHGVGPGVMGGGGGGRAVAPSMGAAHTAAERPVRAGGGAPAPRMAMAAPSPAPAPMRDPFQPPASVGGGAMGSPGGGGGGNGYWYQDPQTGEQMYSTGGGVADDPQGEISYWRSVLKQGGAQNPQLSNMIHRQIAELEALRAGR